jgi:hypothetical protein
MTGVRGRPLGTYPVTWNVTCLQGVDQVLTHPCIGQHEHDTIMYSSMRWTGARMQSRTCDYLHAIRSYTYNLDFSCAVLYSCTKSHAISAYGFIVAPYSCACVLLA